MQYKNFKSGTGKEVRVALTSGHVFLVHKEWQPIPEFAWQDMYSCGAISEDMIKNVSSESMGAAAVAVINSVAMRKETIKQTIRDMIEDNDPEYFMKDGRPKSPEITKRTGLKITNNERDEVWFKLQEELGDDT